MKRIITLGVLFFLFYQAVLYVNKKADEGFFDQYYAKEYARKEKKATWWDRAKEFFKDLFADEEEKFIYK